MAGEEQSNLQDGDELAVSHPAAPEMAQPVKRGFSVQRTLTRSRGAAVQAASKVKRTVSVQAAKASKATGFKVTLNRSSGRPAPAPAELV